METILQNIFDKAVELQKMQIPFVLATVVQGASGSPGRAGFKMIHTIDGNSFGTVGGGELERLILEKCIELHKSKKNEQCN